MTRGANDTQGARLGLPFERPRCLRGPQRRSGKPSTGWFALSVCSPFRRERFAFPFGLWGLLARNAGRPPLSLRDISPTLWGNLPTPRRKLLKKLEQNFYVFYVFSDTLCGNKKAMPSAWCSSVSPAGCRVIRRANSKYFRCHPAHSQLAVSLLAALVPIGSSFFPARLRRLLRILF